MNTPDQSQLGKASAYIDQYDASLLFPIPRVGKRLEIGITGAAPFFGADIWTAFELSWLNLRGKPQVALAHFMVPCETPNIIESKSFKLYLNSFNNTPFADADAVKACLRADLSEAVWRGATGTGQAPASTQVFTLRTSAAHFGLTAAAGHDAHAAALLLGIRRAGAIARSERDLEFIEFVPLGIGAIAIGDGQQFLHALAR